jgi:hypothetical protein
MTRRSTLKIRKPAQKRSTYIERTRQTSRAAQSLFAAANGHDRHWSHEDIRTALLRRHAVELDDLLAELARPAISHAVTKGWIHRTAGEPCFRATTRRRAAAAGPS